MHWSCRVLLSALLISAVAQAADDNLFPFVVSYDAAPSVVNVADWLPRPAGKDGFVQTKGGEFVVVRNGKPEPIRFWATNNCFGANFPTHEQSERLAARLASLGTNCVRLHHMDSRDIWGKSPNKTIIDPVQLERLDYLVYQYKQHGIYVNINLHVSRWLDEKEGFSGRTERPNYDKGLDNFEPRMIEVQKKYARDLLTHVNPYTKLAYTNDPAVAFVEINNENALFSEWGGRKLDNLPEPYATTFRKLWNTWLKKKYGDTTKLRKAWNVGEWPLGDELLTNGDFSKPLGPPWNVEKDELTGVEVKVEDGGPAGGKKLRIAVAKIGKVAWHPQLTNSGYAVKKGTPYTLTFAAKADQKRSLSVGAKQAHDPWKDVGLSAAIEIGPEWRTVRRVFTADSDDDNVRIGFSSFVPGTYELANVSLRPGGVVGLAKDQTLEDESVPVLKRGDLNTTEAAHADFIQFLWDTERDYWTGMFRFLKDDLKVRSLVAGTQLGWSPVHVQAALDYIDTHSYWQHPHFPGRPWDSRNWTVRNTALVNEPAGTLGGLAAKRVAGMAHTVSEYNHPAPNEFRGEGLPMIAAFGSLQGWGGIFNFAYSHNADFEPRRIQSYFDIKADPARMVHMPACTAMFLRGDVKPADTLVAASLTQQKELELLRSGNGAWGLNTTALGIDAKTSILHRLAMGLGSAPQKVVDAPAVKDLKRFTSDTREIVWDVSQNGAGYFTVDAPRSKLFTGFVRGRAFDLGGVQLKIGKTQLDWATVTLTCLDGKSFDQPGRYLVALSGVVQNKGAELQRLPGDKVTLSDRWGSEPAMCEGVPAEITLPVAAARVKFYPLDEAGKRREPAAVAGAGGKTVLNLGPQHKTLWYEVEVK